MSARRFKFDELRRMCEDPELGTSYEQLADLDDLVRELAADLITTQVELAVARTDLDIERFRFWVARAVAATDERHVAGVCCVAPSTVVRWVETSNWPAEHVRAWVRDRCRAICDVPERELATHVPPLELT